MICITNIAGRLAIHRGALQEEHVYGQLKDLGGALQGAQNVYAPKS